MPCLETLADALEDVRISGAMGPCAVEQVGRAAACEIGAVTACAELLRNARNRLWYRVPGKRRHQRIAGKQAREQEDLVCASHVLLLLALARAGA